MIKHIVLWKLKEPSNHENALKIKQDLEGLVNHIPEISKIEVGINFNTQNVAYDVCLYSEFKSIDDLESYQNNPKHKEVGRFISQVVLDRVVCDYEC